jgi:hypothetical protein
LNRLLVSPENGIGVAAPLSVEKRTTRLAGEVCPDAKVFGAVPVGKRSKKEQEGARKSKK